MLIKQLIEKLKKLDPNTVATISLDGKGWSNIDYITKNGKIVGEKYTGIFTSDKN